VVLCDTGQVYAIAIPYPISSHNEIDTQPPALKDFLEGQQKDCDGIYDGIFAVYSLLI
jgi:hypothetical protein